MELHGESTSDETGSKVVKEFKGLSYDILGSSRIVVLILFVLFRLVSH